MICWDRVAISTGSASAWSCPHSATADPSQRRLPTAPGAKCANDLRRAHVEPNAHRWRSQAASRARRNQAAMARSKRTHASPPRGLVAKPRLLRAHPNPHALTSAKCTNEISKRHARTRRWPTPAPFSRTIYLAPAMKLGPRLPGPNGSSPRPRAKKDGLPQKGGRPVTAGNNGIAPP